jgi:hypothetical protein
MSAGHHTEIAFFFFPHFIFFKELDGDRLSIFSDRDSAFFWGEKGFPFVIERPAQVIFLTPPWENSHSST